MGKIVEISATLTGKLDLGHARERIAELERAAAEKAAARADIHASTELEATAPTETEPVA